MTQAHCPKNSKCEGRKLACPLIKVLMNHMEMLATKRNVTICLPGLKNKKNPILNLKLVRKKVSLTYFSLTCVAPLHLLQQAFKMNKVCRET